MYRFDDNSSLQKFVLVTLVLLTAACGNSTWNDVYVDYPRVREDLKNRESHVIEGVGYELVYVQPSAFVRETPEGYKEALITPPSGKIPVVWTVDCENRLQRIAGFGTDQITSMEKPRPNSKGEIVSAYICKLPSTKSIY
jgi:hypothetical protein